MVDPCKLLLTTPGLTPRPANTPSSGVLPPFWPTSCARTASCREVRSQLDPVPADPRRENPAKMEQRWWRCWRSSSAMLQRTRRWWCLQTVYRKNEHAATAVTAFAGCVRRCTICNVSFDVKQLQRRCSARIISRRW
ncbi:hypothetical protein M8494_27290 [Serratia ureilytica]